MSYSSVISSSFCISLCFIEISGVWTMQLKMFSRIYYLSS